MLDPSLPNAEELADQLSNLRAFLFAAEAQSMATAGKKLFRSASAITRSVTEIEGALGLPLFERSARAILLNRFGALALIRARRIHAELQHVAAELARRDALASPSPSILDHILFDGRKLRLLVALADLRRMSAAAARLGLSQSGASMALTRIEAALGTRLFERGQHGIIPTDLADRIVVRAKRVLAELRHMLADLSAERGTLGGSVIIGTPPLGRTQILPRAIVDALRQHPAIQITMMETSFEQLLAGLRSGDVDAVVAVPRGHVEARELTVEPLFDDRLAIVARADHPLTAKARLDLAALAGAQWILPWSRSPSRALIETCFRDAGLMPPLASVESADLAVIRQLLMSSDLIAVASTRQLRLELDTSLLVELPLALHGLNRKVALIMRNGTLLSPAATTLVEAIRGQADLPDAITSRRSAPPR